MNRIVIRATKLETYWTCPYRYKNEPELDEDVEHFKFGSALHKYIELLLNKWLNETTEVMLLSEWWVKQRLMISKMALLVSNLVEQKWYELVCSERTNKIFFEDLNIKLQWTYDHLFKDKEWSYILVDIKTAKSKRTQEHKDGVRQNIIYPALIKMKYNIDIKRFEYWVMTKTSNPDLEDISFEIIWDTVEEVKYKLTELRKAEESNNFPPKYWNHSCFYCPLREQCRWYAPPLPIE